MRLDSALSTSSCVNRSTHSGRIYPHPPTHPATGSAWAASLCLNTLSHAAQRQVTAAQFRVCTLKSLWAITSLVRDRSSRITLGNSLRAPSRATRGAPWPVSEGPGRATQRVHVRTRAGCS